MGESAAVPLVEPAGGGDDEPFLGLAWAEAIEATELLRSALAALGLAEEIPRLRGDVNVYGRPMVTVGRITPTAARRLAAALSRAAQYQPRVYGQAAPAPAPVPASTTAAPATLAAPTPTRSEAGACLVPVPAQMPVSAPSPLPTPMPAPTSAPVAARPSAPVPGGALPTPPQGMLYSTPSGPAPTVLSGPSLVPAPSGPADAPGTPVPTSLPALPPAASPSDSIRLPA
ncbi:MAG: hypothetical protein HOW97_06135 [Catenulispora sp.]|nr:hypothetical protein [Catenulispora sp.]